jgi:hypothetical protein
MNPYVANSFLADSPPTDSCPSNDEMGEAALDFVQRFDLQVVLRNFEKELRELAVGQAQGDAAAAVVVPCAKLD